LKGFIKGDLNMKKFDFDDKDLVIAAIVLMSMTCFLVLAFFPTAPVIAIFEKAILVLGTIATGIRWKSNTLSKDDKPVINVVNDVKETKSD